MSFALCLLIEALSLFIPGYLVARLLGYSSDVSLLGAPALGIAVLSVLGAGTSALGTHPTLLGVAIVAAVGALALWALRRRGIRGEGPFAGSREWLVETTVCVVLGVALGALILSSHTSSFGGYFNQNYDAPFHVNRVRAILDSGDFSPFKSFIFFSGEGSFVSSFELPDGMYPSAFHMLCALGATGGGSVLASVNAGVFLFSFVVYPLSVLLLLRTLFPGRRRLHLVATLAALSTAGFPWFFQIWGPVWANVAGFAMIPALSTFFILVFERNLDAPRRMGRVVAFLIAGIGVAPTHPGAIFATAVFLIPWVAAALRGEVLRRGRGPVAGWVSVALFVVAAGLAWFLVTNLPQFQGIVHFPLWKPFREFPEALKNIFFLGYCVGTGYEWGYQPLLALILAVGFFTVARSRENSWLCWSYLLSAVMMLVAVTVSDDAIRAVTIGFWYQDPYRVAAFALIFAAPLIAVGMDRIAGWVAGLAARIRDSIAGSESDRDAWVPSAASVVTLGALAGAIFFLPQINVAGREFIPAFERYGHVLAWTDARQAPLGPEEKSFLVEAKDIVGNDVVANNPFDGSLYAFAVDDIHCLYRYMVGFDSPFETEASKVIRTRLVDVATDPEVREVVRDSDIRYVLRLNVLDLEDSYLKEYYHPEQWVGIDSITDETPGFRLVLSQGDLRLYEITAVD